MNTTSNSSRAAFQAAHKLPTYFTQDSHALENRAVLAGSNTGRFTSERTAMNYRNVKSRASYATALYAAAIAALLSGCTQTDVAREPEAAKAVQLSEAAASDVPEVVITASRERPPARG